MCLGCWDKAGQPWRLTDAVTASALLFREADPYGPLHIVIDDWNLDDGSLLFCRSEEPSIEEVALLDALAAMTEAERWMTAILAHYPDFARRLILLDLED